MIFQEDRATGTRVQWPVKPVDRPAMAPQDATIVALLEKYHVESFRVNDGWACVFNENATTISFSTPINKWEKILQTLCEL